MKSTWGKILQLKKSLLYIGLILFSTQILYSQDSITWTQAYKLKWVDFKGRPDSTSKYMAITVADVKYILNYNTSSFSCTVTCVFDTRKSWTKSQKLTTLNHEQGHFDIAELSATKLRKLFKEYVFNPKSVQADFSVMFTKVKIERKNLNDLYDEQTDFSRNQKEQDRWTKKIKTELDKLTIFSSP